MGLCQSRSRGALPRGEFPRRLHAKDHARDTQLAAIKGTRNWPDLLAS